MTVAFQRSLDRKSQVRKRNRPKPVNGMTDRRNDQVNNHLLIFAVKVLDR